MGGPIRRPGTETTFAESPMSRPNSRDFSPTVYFIRFGESGPIKIGKTYKTPAHRLSMLQSGSPVPLHLMASIPAPAHGFTEEDLHRKFAHLWIRGEWFEPTGELTDFIAAHAIAENPRLPCSEIRRRPIEPCEMWSWERILSEPDPDAAEGEEQLDGEELFTALRCAAYMVHDRRPIEQICRMMGEPEEVVIRWVVLGMTRFRLIDILDPDCMLRKRIGVAPEFHVCRARSSTKVGVPMASEHDSEQVEGSIRALRKLIAESPGPSRGSPDS